MSENPFYEDAADARHEHDTESARRRRHETMPSADRQSTLGVAGHDYRAALPGVNLGSGLHFIDNGTAFHNLGRVPAAHVAAWDTVDLRVITAHLDCAVQALRAELAKRQ